MSWDRARICPSEQFRSRTPAETFPGEAASKHSFLFLVRWPLRANLVRPLLREPLSLCLTLNTPLTERGRQGRRERGGGKILSVHTPTLGAARAPQRAATWRAVTLSRHRLGRWVPLSRWREQNPAGPGSPPDSRPRQPRPALPLLGAEHSCTSSLGPAAHSVPGRAQAELREMSLRTDFPESAKQIAAGNHQHKNTSNGRGAPKRQLLLGVHTGHGTWAAIKSAGGETSVSNT